MRLAVLAAAAVTVLSACTPAGSSASGPSTRPATRAEITAALLTRPLKLPTLPAGSACPVTPVASRAVGLTDPRGRGPFYLGGQLPKGASPWNKTVFVVIGPPVPDPILFRGGRIDGPGRLLFSGQPPTPSDQGVSLSSGGGANATFYDRALHPAGGDAFYLYPSTSGCYAIQVDASTFEDVIVVTAS